jgi:hypothetical protein
MQKTIIHRSSIFIKSSTEFVGTFLLWLVLTGCSSQTGLLNNPTQAQKQSDWRNQKPAVCEKLVLPQPPSGWLTNSLHERDARGIPGFEFIDEQWLQMDGTQKWPDVTAVNLWVSGRKMKNRTAFLDFELWKNEILSKYQTSKVVSVKRRDLGALPGLDVVTVNAEGDRLVGHEYFIAFPQKLVRVYYSGFEASSTYREFGENWRHHFFDKIGLQCNDGVTLQAQPITPSLDVASQVKYKN